MATYYRIFRARWLMIAVLQAVSAPLAANPEHADLRIAQPSDALLPRPMIGIAASASPALVFHLAVNFRCPGVRPAGSLFTSIADTTRQDALPTGQPSPVTIRMEVPIRQIPWLEEPAVACATMKRRPDEIGTNGIEYFRLHAAATGYVALTCRSEEGRESAADASIPLDVWLSCPIDAASSAAR
jgi:hypothetical protein